MTGGAAKEVGVKTRSRLTGSVGMEQAKFTFSTASSRVMTYLGR